MVMSLNSMENLDQLVGIDKNCSFQSDQNSSVAKSVHSTDLLLDEDDKEE